MNRKPPIVASIPFKQVDLLISWHSFRDSIPPTDSGCLVIAYRERYASEPWAYKLYSAGLYFEDGDVETSFMVLKNNTGCEYGLDFYTDVYEGQEIQLIAWTDISELRTNALAVETLCHKLDSQNEPVPQLSEEIARPGKWFTEADDRDK